MLKISFIRFLQKIQKSGVELNSSGKIDKDKIKSLFANLDDIKEYDYEKLLDKAQDILDSQDLNDALDTEDETFETVIKGLFEIEDIKEAADENKDEKLTNEEIVAFLTSIMEEDGNKDGLTLEDIEKTIDKLDINLRQEAKAIDKAVKEEKKTQEAAKAASGGKLAGNGKVSGNTADTSSNPEGQPSFIPEGQEEYAHGRMGLTPEVADKSLEGMSLEQLEQEKVKRENNVQQAQNEINSVSNGNNEKVKAAQQKFDTAEDEYKKSVEDDPKVKALSEKCFFNC